MDANTGTTTNDGTPAAPAGRPEWIPEKFWDAEAAAPKVEELAKSYVELELLAGELRRKVGAKKEEWARELEAERLAKRPENPEAYEARLPEELAGQVEIDDGHPLLGWWRQFAFERGLGNEEFNAGLQQFVRWQVESAQAQAQALEGELGKLGDHAPQRLEHLAGWLRRKVGEEGFASLEPLLSSAAAVEALEKLMETAGEPRFTPPEAGPQLDEARLREMVHDPRYWRDHDPEFVTRVTEGFRSLYGAQARNA